MQYDYDTALSIINEKMVKELLGERALVPMFRPFEADGYRVWCVLTGNGSEFVTICWSKEDYK